MLKNNNNEKGAISRRRMLRLMGAGGAGLALAACAPVAQPAAAPAKSAAEPAKEVAPTTAPAAASETGEMKILICCSGPDETDLRVLLMLL